nr:sigma-70 family RNA polymerase sigma factor [Planctomycetales bacterium]
ERGSRGDDVRSPMGAVLEGRCPDLAQRLDQRELGACLRAAAAQLPDPLREIVKLVYFEGLKYREAAEVLSIPVGTLKSRMHRALGLLKQQLPLRVAAAAA